MTTPLEPGAELFGGKYQVIGLLGSGSYGTVYHVRETRFGVERAIKLLRVMDPGVGSTVYERQELRFRLEYQLGTQLDHANVIRAMAVEEDQGAICLVMEYAAGGNLARHIRERGRLEQAEALAILRDCARGLRALHAMDAIHRDVKPSNILLMATGRAKIADLGLAQVPGGPTDREKVGSAAPTHPGTLEYKSPEHQSSDYLQPTSDVYSLGSVAWEMLTGRPWRTEMAKVSSLKDSLRDCPAWLDALVMRMLAETPAFRPQDAADPAKRFVNMDGVLAALDAGEGAGGGRAERSGHNKGPDLSRAVELMDADRFDEAIAMLEALVAGGNRARAVEALLADAREAQVQREAREHLRQEYQAIAALARGKRTEARALDEWAAFRQDNPAWDEDPAGLAAWAQAHPIMLARRRQEEEARQRQAAEAEAQARHKAGAELLTFFDKLRQAEVRRKAEEEAAGAKRWVAAAKAPAPTSLKPSPAQQQLLDIMLDMKQAPEARAEAGRKLAELGDPRPGVGLRPDGLPDVAWCEVPAGAFIMGSDGHHADEKPRRTVALQAFAIGKYPVTFAQFQAFVTAPDGHRQSTWWHEPCKSVMRQDRTGVAHWPIGNHPAENVSWCDAVAFTRWMTARLRRASDLDVGMEIRLPTEEEWEKAARGTDGRVYPWGNSFEAGKANINEKFTGAGPSSLVRTTAVGSYPAGASPFGAMDMAGNVREWTLTEYESRQSKDLTNGRPRAVRGGSWNRYPGGVRTSCRYSLDPDHRNNDVGFRVVRGAPVQ